MDVVAAPGHETGAAGLQYNVAIMYQLDPSVTSLSSLFTGHQQLPAIREAVLEGRLGRVWGNALTSPACARLDLGCYAIFGGDPSAKGSDPLVADVASGKELVYPDAAWRERLLTVHGSKARDRPMDSFSGDRLVVAHLQELSETLPTPYRLESLTSQTAAELDDELVPHALQTHDSPEALAEEGLAWGVFTSGSHQRLVSVASSYARSSRLVEVAISTRPGHRGQGLAAAVAARFCLTALQLGLEPCWNASNPISKRLARRLGFYPNGVCNVLFLESDSATR